ncbi:MAG: gliding motility-associated C-terminal domain-containing protein [Prevotellaceae bacterium]|jgi:gliding motility-associated-like protein|nr:gliding motility-associated C-terminal domain-containing protein [Prevotellaceae bacterium]
MKQNMLNGWRRRTAAGLLLCLLSGWLTGFDTLSPAVVPAGVPLPAPVAVLLSENGTAPAEPVNLYPGDAYTGNAPLEFRFRWQEDDEASTDASTLRFEWSFARDAQFTDILLTRFDAETIYTFAETGTFHIRLTVTDPDTGETVVSDPFIIRIAESELKVPNAFSPNGDGVNDLFRVAHKSLVRFRAVIYNRWGQEMYRWGLSNIDAGWDGTRRGTPVAAGVYFIVLEAEGADGIRYNIRGDVNLLR